MLIELLLMLDGNHFTLESYLLHKPRNVIGKSENLLFYYLLMRRVLMMQKINPSTNIAVIPKHSPCPDPFSINLSHLFYYLEKLLQAI